MNAEFDQGEADPTDPCAGPSADPAAAAGTGVLTGPPADLVASYRDLMLNREADWAGLVIGHRGDPEGGIARASRKIRQHPYWRTLTDPATVARAARDLAALGRQDPDDGPPVQPFRPVHLEQDRTFSVGPRDPAVRRDLARELDQAGLWDELTEAERRAEREFVAQTGCCLRFGLVHMDRRFFADGEGMAERGALRELDEIAPALAAAGVALDVVVVSDPFRPPPPGGEDYVLEINGLRCEIRAAAGPRRSVAQLWYESMTRPYVVINELLAAAGSRERIYLDLSGETVYLLPQEVRAVLVKGVYEGFGEESLVLVDRSVWDAPAQW